MMLTIIAEIKVKSDPKHLKAVINALKNIIPVVLMEDGCLLYELLVNSEVNMPYQVPLHHNTLIILEKWQSIDHLNKHLTTQHMQAYQEKVKNDVISVKISILENSD